MLPNNYNEDKEKKNIKKIIQKNADKLNEYNN